jgi:hypothetical protein
MGGPTRRAELSLQSLGMHPAAHHTYAKMQARLLFARLRPASRYFDHAGSLQQVDGWIAEGWSMAEVQTLL